jgi:hypothetical protein
MELSGVLELRGRNTAAEQSGLDRGRRDFVWITIGIEMGIVNSPVDTRCSDGCSRSWLMRAVPFSISERKDFSNVELWSEHVCDSGGTSSLFLKSTTFVNKSRQSIYMAF